MTMEAPAMTEEDQYGYNMPIQYMCEACKAVMFHLNATMTAKHPGSRKWKEFEVLDVLEEICTPPTFEGYGIKKLGGKNRLSGPALSSEEEEIKAGQASIQMGGDTWKKRMAEECRKIVHEKYDDQIYSLWQEKKLSKELCVKNEPMCKSTDQSHRKKKKQVREKADAEAKGSAEPAKAELSKAGTLKKEKGGKLKKEKGGEKKITLDTYLKKLARIQQRSEDFWTKPRTETDWTETLPKLQTEAANRPEL